VDSDPVLAPVPVERRASKRLPKAAHHNRSAAAGDSDPVRAGRAFRLLPKAAHHNRSAAAGDSDPVRAGRAFRLLPRIARRPRLKPKAARLLQGEGRLAATEAAVHAVTEVITAPAGVVESVAPYPGFELSTGGRARGLCRFALCTIIGS